MVPHSIKHISTITSSDLQPIDVKDSTLSNTPSHRKIKRIHKITCLEAQKIQ